MHAPAGGYVVGAGVHMSVYTFVIPQKFESNFSDQTLFNIRGRASGRIYRLALLLRTPEMLFSSSISRIILYNVYLALFVWIDDTITCTNT